MCDQCNNYFARKIEGPILSSEYFRHARSTMQVSNKRGLTPPQFGLLPHLRMSADVWLDGSSITVEPHDRKRSGDFERALLRGERGSLWLPIPSAIDQKLMSRFLGKIAIEALALRLMGVKGWREEILNLEAMEPLRQHVRTGNGTEIWHFTRRRIYPEDQQFGSSTERFEVLHEFNFLYTAAGNLIFVIAIFGEEFSIDMGNPNSSCYDEYIKSNEGLSFLAPWD